MSTPHHYRYATVGSKSDSEVGFWTSSDVQIWGSELQAVLYFAISCISPDLKYMY